MPSRLHVARDISYAHSAETKGGKMVIKLMENTTGRMRLIKRADGYEKEVPTGRISGRSWCERYGLVVGCGGRIAGEHPKADGPLILIANHPYGILDGLMMGHMLSRDARRFPHSGKPRFPQGRGPEPYHSADLI